MDRNNGSDGINNPSFPFSSGSGFSGYLFRNNQPELCRIILLKKGSLVYTTETAYERISIPSLFFISPNKRCSLKSFADTDADYLVFSPLFLDQVQFFCWKDRVLRNYIQQFFRTDGDGQNSEHPRQELSSFLLEQITEIFNTLIMENEKKLPCSELLILHQVVRLFILLYRSTGNSENADEPAIWQIDDLIDYINKHYADEFSLQEMAEKYSFSPSYFSRRFSEKTGMPLFEYINYIRIQKACQLLKRSQMPIIEIAFAVGYNNLSFFNRYFRKIMQASPREYRNQVQR